MSDTVAILNYGELVAQASIGELLAGSGGTVYRITFKGGYEEAQSRISAQEWVSGVTVVPGDLRTTLQVAVTDEEVAEDELARLAVSDGKATVTECARQPVAKLHPFVNVSHHPNVAIDLAARARVFRNSLKNTFS